MSVHSRWWHMSIHSWRCHLSTHSESCHVCIELEMPHVYTPWTMECVYTKQEKSHAYCWSMLPRLNTFPLLLARNSKLICLQWKFTNWVLLTQGSLIQKDTLSWHKKACKGVLKLYNCIHSIRHKQTRAISTVSHPFFDIEGQRWWLEAVCDWGNC